PMVTTSYLFLSIKKVGSQDPPRRQRVLRDHSLYWPDDGDNEACQCHRAYSKEDACQTHPELLVPEEALPFLFLSGHIVQVETIGTWVNGPHGHAHGQQVTEQNGDDQGLLKEITNQIFGRETGAQRCDREQDGQKGGNALDNALARFI